MAPPRRPEQLRVGNALVLWGALALAGWLMVLVPAWIAVTKGADIVAALFDGERAATSTASEDPAGDPALIKQLNEIAPAAGGKQDTAPKK